MADREHAELIARHARVDRFRRAVASLPYPVRALIERHHGLNGESPRSLAAAAHSLGLSEIQARSMELDAFARLRALLEGDEVERLAA
jgi:DNA-directed RNA polymerase sigma subunit (sigma70/sigma32)